MVVLMFEKPPKRIRDKKFCARFVATRVWCQMCGRTEGLQIHHLKVPSVHRRSDVFANVMRLCYVCHEQVEMQRAGSKPEVVIQKWTNELEYALQYAELEEAYDGEVVWAGVSRARKWIDETLAPFDNSEPRC